MTASDGTKYSGYRRNWKRIRRLQRAVSRCKEGSGTRRKRAAKIARYRRKEHVVQRNACHRATTELVRRNGLIAVEKLKVKNMTGLPRLNLGDTATSQHHFIVRTTVTLDDDIYEAALCQARATGRRLGSELSEIARHALRPEPQPHQGSRQDRRFPSFEVPPCTRIIPASRVQKVLDEDGIA